MPVNRRRELDDGRGGWKVEKVDKGCSVSANEDVCLSGQLKLSRNRQLHEIGDCQIARGSSAYTNYAIARPARLRMVRYDDVRTEPTGWRSMNVTRGTVGRRNDRPKLVRTNRVKPMSQVDVPQCPLYLS
eukprot:CAMPEP_0115842964 /NCGR_PEP_ID=MMETSP0287-20121206/8070_1 /TAXON_ID=412157 /ORGANISM="Chrysochromulina rotalis, Strain UIO044" /LENGTH=129 /DNA_ID=CAMNT_0003296647 /DNA_START=786 /DNA_END=1175 /DNA_ORIENTATION=+